MSTRARRAGKTDFQRRPLQRIAFCQQALDIQTVIGRMSSTGLRPFLFRACRSEQEKRAGMIRTHKSRFLYATRRPALHPGDQSHLKSPNSPKLTIAGCPLAAALLIVRSFSTDVMSAYRPNHPILY
jgi:hypothetical protein